jgi:hypothetical protein
VNRRTAEVDGERCAGEFVVQLADLVDEQLQTLDLHRRSGKAVENDSVSVDRVEQRAEEDADDLLVADHHPKRLQLLHLRRRQQLADDDRRTGQAARLVDELRLGSLTRARRAAEQDDLLRETEMLPPDVLLERLPDRREDHAGILDLEIENVRPAVDGSRHAAPFAKRGGSAAKCRGRYTGWMRRAQAERDRARFLEPAANGASGG